MRICEKPVIPILCWYTVIFFHKLFVSSNRAVPSLLFFPLYASSANGYKHSNEHLHFLTFSSWEETLKQTISTLLSILFFLTANQLFRWYSEIRLTSQLMSMVLLWLLAECTPSTTELSVTSLTFSVSTVNLFTLSLVLIPRHSCVSSNGRGANLIKF